MIDESRTLEIYGYTSDELKPHSNKRVVAVCEECGKYRVVPYYTRNRCSELCVACCQIGERNPQYGKHLSVERKNNLSESQRGEKSCHYRKHVPNLTRKRISRAKIGNVHHSEEAKKKMSEKRRGKNNPMYGHRLATCEILQKRSKKTRGDKHWNWQGGISFDKYCSKFNEKFKESIREEFGRVCFLCGKPEEMQKEECRDQVKRVFRLSVHHVSYDKNCICNGVKCEFVPLCKSCHIKTNHNRQYWEDLIMCYLYPERAWLPDI